MYGAGASASESFAALAKGDVRVVPPQLGQSLKDRMAEVEGGLIGAGGRAARWLADDAVDQVEIGLIASRDMKTIGKLRRMEFVVEDMA